MDIPSFAHGFSQTTCPLAPYPATLHKYHLTSTSMTLGPAASQHLPFPAFAPFVPNFLTQNWGDLGGHRR